MKFAVQLNPDEPPVLTYGDEDAVARFRKAGCLVALEGEPIYIIAEREQALKKHKKELLDEVNETLRNTPSLIILP